MNSLPETNLEHFGLAEENLFKLDERTLIVKKWNWDYSQAHAFQRHALNILQNHPRQRILICCSHPRVLTNGRGLQKPRKGESFELKEFNPSEYKRLPYPLHQIERGGGLTFHHPGQFIFYPIVKLNPASLSLSKMTDEIFDFAIEVLNNWGATGLTHSKKLLGLWQYERKMASMGIAIEKLTTFHGMALNLYQDREMKIALKIMNPCGLSADTYISAEEICSLPEDAQDKFTEEFLKRIKHGWQ
jgi:lipoyl(octanoyl) transferase